MVALNTPKTDPNFRDQIREINNIVRLGELEAVMFATRLTKNLTKQAIRGEVFPGGSIRQAFVDALFTTLRDGTIIAYVYGYRFSVRLAAPHLVSPLELSLRRPRNILRRFIDPTTRIELEKEFGARAFTVVDNLGAITETQLRSKIADVVEKGLTEKQAVRELRKVFDNLGLTNTSDYRIKSIFRTQSQIAYNAGRWNADQHPAIQEILWGYEYVTMGDDRVRPEHEALEGLRRSKESAAWNFIWPPNGWNCRCSVFPIFNDETKFAKDFTPSEVEGNLPEDFVDPDFRFNTGRLRPLIPPVKFEEVLLLPPLKF